MKLYNSLTNQKEEFIPIEKNKVKMYNCGPTVYNYIHVGNARPLVVFDTLRRYFMYQGYDVDFVVNFTDIDDKIINRAEEEGVSAKDIATKYIEEFKKDVKGLNLYDHEIIHPKATEFITEIIEFISELVEKEAAYPVGSDVYFDITKAKDYGKLSGKNIDDLMAGARVDVNEDKKNPLDFVLWKGQKYPEEPAWDSPWGKGRPGWHIECSVMAESLLGETIDIHSGGVDLQFPHHENEIAQSETKNDQTFANYWLHNGFITVDQEKMSKSLGNFFTLREVGEEYDMELVRFFLLSAHYRQPINFSDTILEQQKAGLDRLYTGKYRLDYLLDKTQSRDLTTGDQELIDKKDQWIKLFEDAMDDDMNTARAITAMYELVRDANSKLDENSNRDVVEAYHNGLMAMAGVLGILTHDKEEITDDEILTLIDERTQARENKDYDRADEIRDELLEKGIQLEDTRDGVTFRRV